MYSCTNLLERDISLIRACTFIEVFSHPSHETSVMDELLSVMPCPLAHIYCTCCYMSFMGGSACDSDVINASSGFLAHY